jgi:hypothetical protein
MAKNPSRAAAVTAPAIADVVAEAAAILSAPDLSPKQAVLAEALEGFKPVAVTPAGPAPIDPADTARDQARALAIDMNDEDIPVAPAFFTAPVKFPIRVNLRNNSSIPLSEPITGAYLPAGGAATVQMHDEAHAESVMDSLQKLAETNYLKPGSLVGDPA